MKMPSSKFLGFSTALLLSASSLFAQTTATTDPVGFITLNVYGGGSVASPKLSLVSPTLTQPVLWQGAVTGTSATTITVSGNPWTVNQFNGAAGSHYVEIAAGTAARTGTLADITATASNVITTAQATGVAIGDSIKIRKDVTIADLFGATNSANLLASDDPATADEVLVYSGAAFTAYFYFTGAPGFPTGWYDSAFSLAPGEAQKVSIAPSEAVVVKRKGAGVVAVVFTGSVKTGNTLIPIQNGLNVLGTASAKGLTLDTSGLYTGSATTGVLASDDPATGDEVTLYTATSQINYFYYTGSPGFPAGWYDSAFSLAPGVAGTRPIAPGTAFVLKRKTGAAFNWTLPSPTSF